MGGIVAPYLMTHTHLQRERHSVKQSSAYPGCVPSGGREKQCAASERLHKHRYTCVNKQGRVRPLTSVTGSSLAKSTFAATTEFTHVISTLYHLFLHSAFLKNSDLF